MLFVQYPPCSTCRKARQWLDEVGLSYTARNIKEENPTKQELEQRWHKSGLPLRKWFNTSGQLYKAMGLKDKLPAMTEEEQLALLASDGMLVKRPILVAGDTVLIGFRSDQWAEALGKGVLTGN